MKNPRRPHNLELPPPSELLYRPLVEHMNEAVWVGDKNERTLYANPKFCELMEYSLPEMLGRESYDFWDKASAERVRWTNKHHRALGVSSSYEGNLQTKSGKLIPVLLSGASLPNGGTIGIMTDLRELKKSESLFKKLIENMNEAVWMGDAAEKTVYANPKFCQMLGFRLEEILGKESFYFWDKETAKRVRWINVHHRMKGMSSSYEGNLLTKSEKKIPVLVSGTPLPDGGTYGIITDLSELKEKEQARRVLSSAVEYATDAIVIFDNTGKVISWNKGAKIIFGYKKDEIIGQALDRIFPKEGLVTLLEHSRILYNVELRGIHKNRHPVSISATLTPIVSEDKKSITFCLLIARDITTQKKFEEELAIKYQKMKEAYNKFGVIRRQMDYVFEILELCDGNHDEKGIADYIVSSLIMLTRADACVLRLYNPRRNTLDYLSSFGVGIEWQGKANIPLDGSLGEQAFQNHQSIKIIDVAREPRYRSASLAKKNKLCSLLLIPLQFQSKPIGTLSLYTRPEKKLEIFENEFIEKYAKLIEIILWMLVNPAASPGKDGGASGS